MNHKADAAASLYESHAGSLLTYAGRMANDKKNHASWQGWGARFRLACQLKGLTIDQVADKLGRHPSSVRSWTNGNRQINLDEFFRLCAAAGIDPAPILFARAEDKKLLEILLAWAQADESERKLLQVAAKAVLSKDAQQRKPGESSSK